MDAAEADADIKLYKASAELLLELNAKVPRLVNQTKKHNTPRKWVLDTKTSEVTRLLDSFQEWPQLLDPHLSSLVQTLVDAYLSYCMLFPNEYLREHDLRSEVSPLPRAIARVLYAFTKVRGHKIIVRLLNNEPKYVEPLLSCFQLWSSPTSFENPSNASTMTWEERYIHLLWLSHLMLAPFELSTISGLSTPNTVRRKLSELYSNLPTVSINLTIIGLDHLYAPGKAREAACTLLIRLSLRADMQRLGLVQRLVTWASNELNLPGNDPQNTGYRNIGLLALLFGIINSSSDSEAAPFHSTVFRLAHTAATSPLEQHKAVRDSAPARKLLVKTMRSSVVHGIALSVSAMSGGVNLDLNTMLEDCIQTLLDFLSDKDTPVRQAASKALSLICLKLDAEQSAEVVEAVIDTLNENILLEDIVDGRLFPITDVTKSTSTKYKKNLNAVDPLKWHGCMLTLGHLLFRRSLPTSLLSTVIEVLLMGLDFEQRSNVGTSVGVGVRDAACFGIWSLARKYSTIELNATSISSTLFLNAIAVSHGAENSTLQLVASYLAVSACLDPSGNLRRGSSAALQELIGRHPDSIVQGIRVVQTVDYQAVARRSRAMIEVSVAASKLSGHYHGALLYALLAWRGARATDADSRRDAAQAVGLLVSMAPKHDVLVFLNEIVSQIQNLKLSNIGSNAAARHGLLCCLAKIVENISQRTDISLEIATFDTMRPILEDISSIIGTIDGRVTADVENVLEATSLVILACATFISTSEQQIRKLGGPEFSSQWSRSVLFVLNRCTVASDKNFVTNVAAQANIAVLKLLPIELRNDLLSSWLDQKRQGKADFICKGRIVTLGYGFNFFGSGTEFDLDLRIAKYLTNLVHSKQPIETKVNAMQSITTIFASTADVEAQYMKTLMAAVRSGLVDYTIDRRGDVGSLLRLESIEAVKQLGLHKIAGKQMEQVLQLIVKLAAEKLVKARFEAWKCFEKYSGTMNLDIKKFNHQADVSSFGYFENLLKLLNQPQYFEHLLIGFISSMTGGTEEIARACSEAYLCHTQNLDSTAQKSLVTTTLQCVMQFLDRNAGEDDREVVPLLDFISFIAEHVLIHQPSLSHDSDMDQIWKVSQKVHAASPTLMRTESMIRLYSALVSLKSYRTRALDKLTRLLLHRWPKVRSAAADSIFLYTAMPSLTMCDWNAPVADNKPVVLSLRKELDVVGPTSKMATLQPAVAA